LTGMPCLPPNAADNKQDPLSPPVRKTVADMDGGDQLPLSATVSRAVLDQIEPINSIGFIDTIKRNAVNYDRTGLSPPDMASIHSSALLSASNRSIRIFSAREPEVGEIVVFYTPFPDERAQQMLRAFDKFMDLFTPKQFKGSVKYVKRLVAKEGDVITLKEVDGNWKLFVNGQIPEHLKDVNYTREGVFRYPKLWEYLAEASKYKNDKNQYRNYLLN